MSTYQHYGLKKRHPVELSGLWAFIGAVLALAAGGYALLCIWPLIGAAIQKAASLLQ